MHLDRIQRTAQQGIHRVMRRLGHKPKTTGTATVYAAMAVELTSDEKEPARQENMNITPLAEPTAARRNEA